MGKIIGDTESKRKNHVREAARLDHVPGAKGSLPILNTVPIHSAIKRFIDQFIICLIALRLSCIYESPV